MARFRSAYGDSPLHLLAVLASFAIAGYAFLRIVENPSALGTLVWFGGAAVAHDLIAFPLYSALNLIAHRSIEGPDDAWEERRRVPIINLNREMTIDIPMGTLAGRVTVVRVEASPAVSPTTIAETPASIWRSKSFANAVKSIRSFASNGVGRSGM